ncbi:Protein kinase [Sorangium cellulosum So ce56]|uniref:Protein kinase n=2 Tax=Sorangium cellulosum TaxID=56 RepID=A9GJA9_SORC5|nr:Protein kinase [Sorangium cellulosum So ce56]
MSTTLDSPRVQRTLERLFQDAGGGYPHIIARVRGDWARRGPSSSARRRRRRRRCAADRGPPPRTVLNVEALASRKIAPLTAEKVYRCKLHQIRTPGWGSDMVDVDSTVAMSAVFGERYQLVSALGEGGFGTVFKARQLATGQHVAIKVLRLPKESTAQAQEQRIARFHREMQLCAQLHHPNIVRLIDSRHAEGSVVCSVFEFVPGNNLAEVLEREGQLDPVETRHLMMQILDALACAHAQGVVHRDLKPANIMIVPTGARRNALVLDFGIGGFIHEARHEKEARITLTDESVGTPSYAAPEQLRSQHTTPRSDFYAWGLLFLECLTGKRVVEGATVAEVVFKQLSAEPIPIPPEIADHPLGDILRRVTAKDPAARQVTAASLLRELEACDVAGLRPGARDRHPGRAAQDAETPVSPGKPGSDGRHLRLVQGERRQITAVCCILSAAGVGSRAADLEELDHVLGLQQEVCAELARRFGGHVAGGLGDAVLFYFGYPKAREDDARRAARAALAIASEVARRSAALEAARKLRVDVRIGIHTGLVVARELRNPASAGLGYVVGTTPKLASRLSHLAEPGGILVSGGTERLLRKQFLLEETGIRVTDDSTMPVSAFALRDGAPSAALREVPLVGRDREIEALLERWARASDGAGQAVLISGEPGIGKSRLARALEERIGARPHAWIECRCTPDSVHSAFYPIIELLERMLDPRREANPEGRVDRLEALLSLYGFELREAVPLFASLLSLPLPKRWTPLDVSPRRKREMTRNAVLSLLFEMGEKEPVALLVEDLHWGDPSTVELLGQLVSEIGSSRLLAIFTARQEFVHPWSPGSLLQIQLGRFGRPEVERMTAQIMGGRSLPAEVLDHITSRTDGVPLFIEELVLAMIEAGALAECEGGCALVRPLSDLSIPATLRDSLVARLDRLGRAKETAQVAAAIGREFTFELLGVVSPLEEAEVQEDLDKLVASGLVYRKRRIKNPAYVFKHALVRDAAYESLLERTCREVHLRIARALEERFPEIASKRPDLLAHHHAAAEQRREAVGYARKAGMAALQRSAYAEAIAAARQALGWIASSKEDDEQVAAAAAAAPGSALQGQPMTASERIQAELELHGVVTPALMASRGWGDDELKSALDRAQALLDRLGDSPGAIPTLWALITYHHARSHRVEAQSLAERALRLAERSGDAGNVVAVLPIYAQCLFFSGKHAEARACLDRALASYDPAVHRAHASTFGQDSKVHALALSGLQWWLLGYPERALEAGTAAVAFARELDDANSLGMALGYLLGVWHYRGEREPAREVAATLAAVAERHGLPQWAELAAMFQGWIDGDPTVPRQLLSGFRAMGAEVAFPYWASIVAECEALAGDLDAAIARIDECLEKAEHDVELYYVSLLHHVKGEFVLKRDPRALDAAERCFRDAIAVAQAQDVKMPELKAVTSLARVLRDRGRREEACVSLAPIYAWFKEGLDTPALVDAKALLKELAGPSFAERAARSGAAHHGALAG